MKSIANWYHSGAIGISARLDRFDTPFGYVPTRVEWVDCEIDPAIFAVEVTPNEVDFGVLLIGYSQPETATITIINTGNRDINHLMLLVL